MSMPDAFMTLIQAIWSQIASVISTITGSPLLLIPVGFLFVGGVIGLAMKLMGTKRRGRR